MLDMLCLLSPPPLTLSRTPALSYSHAVTGQISLSSIRHISPSSISSITHTSSLLLILLPSPSLHLILQHMLKRIISLYLRHFFLFWYRNQGGILASKNSMLIQHQKMAYFQGFSWLFSIKKDLRELLPLGLLLSFFYYFFLISKWKSFLQIKWKWGLLSNM